MPASKQVRSLSEIANEIANDWKTVNPGAAPYLSAMKRLNLITDQFYAEDAKTQVLYFLSNASSWRGDTARRIKKELKAML